MLASGISSAVYQVPAQRTIPRVEFTRVADLSPEEQAALKVESTETNALLTRHQKIMEAAQQQRLADEKGYEQNGLNAPNVKSLSREQALQQIEYMSELIQTGQNENYRLSTGYGDKQTSNYRQYVYWLQQHVKELDAAGQSAPGQAGTGTAGGPFPADYVSEIKRLRTDVPGVKYEDWTPEFKQRVAEGRGRSEALSALARELEARSKLETVEVNDRHAPNVATLTKDQALKQIAYMTELIQSGEAEKTKLYTGYGDKLTNNYRQYVYWLQQHVKELEGAGQSTLAQA